MHDRLLTCEEVARWANVSERTVRRAIARGDLRAGRAGGQLRIAPDDAYAWVFGEPKPLPSVIRSASTAQTYMGGSP